jgi:hypothetical protein
VGYGTKFDISKKRTAVKQISLSLVPFAEAFFAVYPTAAVKGRGACHIGIANPSFCSASVS